MNVPTNGDDEPIACLFCGGPAPVLGVFGRRVHYRCRECEMEFSLSNDDGDSVETSTPGTTISTYDGTTYGVLQEESIAPAEDDRHLVDVLLEAPDGRIWPVTAVIQSGKDDRKVFVTTDWKEDPGPESWEEVPDYTWMNLRTGEPAALIDGIPSPTPGRHGIEDGSTTDNHSSG